jgi:hypothetical protein
MTKRWLALAAAMAIAASAAGCGKQEQDESRDEAPPPLNVNLVENPSFELWDGSVPKGWTMEHFGGEGSKSIMFGPSGTEKRSGSFSFYLRGAFDTDRWMTLTQRHPVLPEHRLWFAAEMKSQKLTKSRGQSDRGNVYVRFYDKDGKRVRDRNWADSWTRSFLGTLDWRKMGKRIDVPKGARTVEIGLLNQVTGWLYFDDVELILEEPVPWRKVETKHVDFYYLEGDPFRDGAIERQTKFVETVVKKLKLDPKKGDKVSYYYYPSDDRFKEIRGFKIGPEHTRVSAGAHEIHTTKTYEDHQMIHLLLEPFGYPPFGLAEGAVFYVLGSWEGGINIHMMAKELLLEKRLPALYRILKHKAMDDIGMSITVPGWSSFSMWLIERHGVEKFLKLYTAVNEIEEPSPFNVHFKNLYGKDFDEMDREWRLWVLRYQPKI